MLDIEGRLLRHLDQARRVLIEPIDVRGRGRERVDADAAELAAGLVESAARA